MSVAEIPVPAKIYFSDFSLEVADFSVLRKGQEFIQIKGLSNQEGPEKYIHFFYGADVCVGDELISRGRHYLVKEIDIDTYHGRPALIKAVY